MDPSLSEEKDGMVGMQPISSPGQGFLFSLKCFDVHLFTWKSLLYFLSLKKKKIIQNDFCPHYWIWAAAAESEISLY